LCKVLQPHAVANGSQCIQIREEMLESSSTVLSTLSPYLVLSTVQKKPAAKLPVLWTTDDAVITELLDYSSMDYDILL